MSEFFDRTESRKCKVLDDPTTSLLNNNNNPVYNCIQSKSLGLSNLYSQEVSQNHLLYQKKYFTSSNLILGCSGDKESDIKETEKSRIIKDAASRPSTSTWVDSLNSESFKERSPISASVAKPTGLFSEVEKTWANSFKNTIRFSLPTSSAFQLKRLALRNPHILRKLGISKIELGREEYLKGTKIFLAKDALNLPNKISSYPLQHQPEKEFFAVNSSNKFECKISHQSTLNSSNPQIHKIPNPYNKTIFVPQQVPMQIQQSSSSGSHHLKSPNQHHYQGNSPFPQPTSNVQPELSRNSNESPLLVNLLRNNTSQQPLNVQSQYSSQRLHSPIHNHPYPPSQVHQQNMSSQMHDQPPFFQKHQNMQHQFMQQQSTTIQHQQQLYPGHLQQQSSQHAQQVPLQHNINASQNYMNSAVAVTRGLVVPPNQPGMMSMTAVGGIPRYPNQVIQSIPPQQNVAPQSVNTNQPLNNTEPQKGKKKRTNKKQKDDKEQQLRMQEQQIQQRILSQMPPGPEFYMMTQQRIPPQQVLHPIHPHPGQQVHHRLQYQQSRMMPQNFHSIQYQQLDQVPIGYQQQTYSHPHQTAPSTSSLASPHFVHNSGYVQQHQQHSMWPQQQPPPPSSQQPHQVMPSNVDFQQYNTMRTQLVQSHHNSYPYSFQQHPQTIQDQRLQQHSLNAGHYSGGINADAQGSMPTTPHTPQQISGDVRGNSFQSHHSSPGSNGGSLSRSGLTEPSNMQVSQEGSFFQKNSLSSPQMQKQDLLLSNLADFGRNIMDDLNVPMSNDDDFDLDSIEPTMHGAATHGIETNQFPYNSSHQLIQTDSKDLHSTSVQSQNHLSSQSFHTQSHSNQAIFHSNDTKKLDYDNHNMTFAEHVDVKKQTGVSFAESANQPQSPSKLTEVQQKNVSDCISAVVQRVMIDPEASQKQHKKPGPPKNSKKKNNSLAKQVLNEPTPLLRAPVPQTASLLDTSKYNVSVFGGVQRVTESPYIPINNLRQADNSDGISRTRTSSMDSLSADRSSVSSYHSSTNSGTAFHSPQLNGHCNVNSYNDSKIKHEILSSTSFARNDNALEQKEPKKHQRKRKRKLEDVQSINEVTSFEFRSTSGIETFGVSNQGSTIASNESTIIR